MSYCYVEFVFLSCAVLEKLKGFCFVPLFANRNLFGILFYVFPKRQNQVVIACYVILCSVSLFVCRCVCSPILQYLYYLGLC